MREKANDLHISDGSGSTLHCSPVCMCRDTERKPGVRTVGEQERVSRSMRNSL